MRSCIIAFALGVLLLQMQQALPSLWGIAACSLLLVPIILTRGKGQIKRNFRHTMWCCVAFSTGFFWAAGYAAWRLSDELPKNIEGEDVKVIGVIASLPQTTERGGRFEFDIERVITAHATIPRHVSINWYRDQKNDTYKDQIPFHAGERWQLQVRLHRPHGTSNPYGFDAELWALENNIRAIGYIRLADENRRLTDLVLRPSYLIEYIRESIRNRFLQVLANKPYGPVLVALAIGDQSAIPQSQWTTFWRTGVGHLISISGSHITMLAALIAGLVAWFWRRTRLSLHLPVHKAAALAGLTTALIYALLAGFSVPTQRTFYMVTIGALALWFNRTGSASRLLALALFFVLLLDPWAVLAPGFWLSFAAVALIFYLTTHRRLEEGWLALAVRVQIAITIGLIPLSIGLFQQVSIISPFANAFAIPLVSFLVVPLSLLAAMLPIDGILYFDHWIVALWIDVLNWFAAWPNATWESYAPPKWAIVVGVVGVAWLLAPRGWPARWLGLLWLLPLAFIAPKHPKEGAAWMTVLDVGQGLAAVVQTKNYALLYDTGPSWGGRHG